MMTTGQESRFRQKETYIEENKYEKLGLLVT